MTNTELRSPYSNLIKFVVDSRAKTTAKKFTKKINEKNQLNVDKNLTGTLNYKHA